MFTTARPGLLTAVVAATLALAACSSSSSGGGGNTSPATSAPPSTSAAPPSSSGPTPPPHAALAAIPVQASDLPSGWKATPADTSNEAAANAAMHNCVGGTDTSPDKVETVNASDYSLNNATISSNVSSFKSEADIAADKQLLQSPKIDSCYKQLLNKLLAKALPSGTTVDNITFHLTPGSGGGPTNLEATGDGVIAIMAQGQSASVYVSVAFISGPLVEAQVTFIDLGQRVDETLQRQIITAVAQRAASV